MNQHVLDGMRERFAVCSELLEMAQRELAAFYAAVKTLSGKDAAERAAREWIEQVQARDALPTSTSGWRRITIAAAQRMAQRVEALTA